MSRSHLCTMLVVVAFFFPVCALAASAIIGPPIVEPPEEVTFPSDEFPTIQSAIDEVADGGTITLRPGRYTESITVTGKSVHFVGSIEPALAKGHKKSQTPYAKLRRDMRSFLKQLPKSMHFLGKTDWELRSTEIIGADPERAVITFGPGGGGSVRDMTLRGGALGIQGKAIGNTPLAQLLIANTHIVAAGQGIFGSFSSIKVQDTMIAHTDWNGLCILEAETVEVLNTIVSDTEAVGLLVFNGGVYTGTIHIANSQFYYNKQGGIAIVGAANPVEITYCLCGENGLAGILLLDVGSVQVEDTGVLYTYEVDTPGLTGVGDGLIAVSREDTVPGDVAVIDCMFAFNYGAGLLFKDCGGEILNTYSVGNLYGLLLLGYSQLDYSDPDNVLSPNTEADVQAEDDGLPAPDEPLPLPVVP